MTRSFTNTKRTTMIAVMLSINIMLIMKRHYFSQYTVNCFLIVSLNLENAFVKNDASLLFARINLHPGLKIFRFAKFNPRQF